MSTDSAIFPNAFLCHRRHLPAGSLSYVERRADQELPRALLAGDYCYVLDTRQMGKSSLMIRTVERLRERDIRSVVIDLTGIGQNLTPERWYAGLLSWLEEQLDLDSALLDLYRKIRAGQRVTDDETDSLQTTLRLAGMFRSVDGVLRRRNRIYDHAGPILDGAALPSGGGADAQLAGEDAVAAHGAGRTVWLRLEADLWREEITR